MNSAYTPGRLARGISGGCGHDGIYRLEKRIEKGHEPDFLEGARTPVWVCRLETDTVFLLQCDAYCEDNKCLRGGLVSSTQRDFRRMVVL